MAIWNGSLLCGLIVGKASRSRTGSESNVTVSFVQGAPQQINRLKGLIMPIALDATEAYATILDRPVIYIKNPVAEVMGYYEDFNFKVARRRCPGVYLERKR